MPGWLALAILGALLGFGIWARSAEPPYAGAELARADFPAWNQEILLPLRIAPPVAPASPLDKLWARTEKARARGDVQVALIGLRTIADDHFEDARTPKAVYMLAAITPVPMERCMALAMTVAMAPASDIASDARQRLPDACAGLF